MSIEKAKKYNFLVNIKSRPESIENTRLQKIVVKKSKNDGLLN